MTPVLSKGETFPSEHHSWVCCLWKRSLSRRNLCVIMACFSSNIKIIPLFQLNAIPPAEPFCLSASRKTPKIQFHDLWTQTLYINHQFWKLFTLGPDGVLEKSLRHSLTLLFSWNRVGLHSPTPTEVAWPCDLIWPMKCQWQSQESEGNLPYSPYLYGRNQQYFQRWRLHQSEMPGHLWWQVLCGISTQWVRI